MNPSQDFFFKAYKHKLDLIAYYQFRNDSSNLLKENIRERLENRFQNCFARWIHQKKEAACLSSFIEARGKKYIFIKGYPLALKIYDHPVVREMADIDLFIDYKDRSSVREYFQEKGFSLVKIEKGLEKKELWLKFFGQNEVCFELHGNIFSSFAEDAPDPDSTFFRSDGLPSAEALYLSVLLHHPYYYSRLRDFVDLFFIEKKLKPDHTMIIEFCRKSGLFKHYTRALKQMAYLSGQGRRPFSLICFMQRFSMSYSSNYNLLSKTLDAFFHFFIYDSFSTGFKCFLNRYGRFFKQEKQITDMERN